MGVDTWEAVQDIARLPLSAKQKYLLMQGIEASQRHLATRDPAFFANAMPAHQCWRLFPEFRDATAYLDIETTGLYRGADAITTIALYNGQRIHTYVQGINLEAFVRDIQNYTVIVSYNGKSFDIPFIEQYFGVHLPQTQIDLRYVLGRLGYKGGLKGCERQLGIDRGDLSDVDGFMAVLLWDEYQRSGNRAALNSLLAYNVQDTVNLEQLMVMAYNLNLRRTPFFNRHQMAAPAIPANPFKPDVAVLQRIKARYEGYPSYGWP